MVRIFRHYIPKSFFVLALIESVVLLSSIYAGVMLRFDGNLEAIEKYVGPLGPRITIYIIVILSTMTAMGLYRRYLRDGTGGMLLRIGASFISGFLILSLIFYMFPSLFIGRGVLGYSLAMGAAGIIVVRLIFMKLVDQEYIKRRILVLGAGKRAAVIEKALRRKIDQRGYTIVGYLHIRGEHDEVEGNIITHDATLLDIAKKYDIDEIVMAVDDRRKSFPMHEILDCRMSGLEVIDLLTFFEREKGKIFLEIIHPSWLVYSDGFRYGAYRVYSKKIFDVVTSMVLLLILWPIMLVTALAIIIEDGWNAPVFYRQVRVGQNWKLFQVLKFRSMRVDAEANGKPQWAVKGDQRITRVGSFIRKTRIDELPQFFNVLKGDMSFVGPRPERPEFVEKLSRKIPYFSERHRVKPGITGWAQICYPYGASEKDATEKLQYDLYYVKNYSLFLDLTILFQTAEVILWGKGAR